MSTSCAIAHEFRQQLFQQLADPTFLDWWRSLLVEPLTPDAQRAIEPAFIWVYNSQFHGRCEPLLAVLYKGEPSIASRMVIGEFLIRVYDFSGITKVSVVRENNPKKFYYQRYQDGSWKCENG
jgi:hypothetical protein